MDDSDLGASHSAVEPHILARDAHEKSDEINVWGKAEALEATKKQAGVL